MHYSIESTSTSTNDFLCLLRNNTAQKCENRGLDIDISLKRVMIALSMVNPLCVTAARKISSSVTTERRLGDPCKLELSSWQGFDADSAVQNVK